MDIASVIRSYFDIIRKANVPSFSIILILFYDATMDINWYIFVPMDKKTKTKEYFHFQLK